MSYPANPPGDPYHPGPARGERTGPPDTGGYAQPGGYGYPTAGQPPQYGAQSPQYESAQNQPHQYQPAQNQQPQYQPAQYQPAQYGTYPPGAAGPWTGYPPIAAPATGRPKVLTAAAALSLLTGSTMGVAGTGLLTAAAAAGATRSALSTFGSTSLPGREIAVAAIIAVIMLATAFVLLWGAIEVALARGTLLAIIGNIVTTVLALIVIVQTSAWLLIWLVIPVIAVVLLVQPSVRTYLASRPPSD